MSSLTIRDTKEVQKTASWQPVFRYLGDIYMATETLEALSINYHDFMADPLFKRVEEFTAVFMESRYRQVFRILKGPYGNGTRGLLYPGAGLDFLGEDLKSFPCIEIDQENVVATKRKLIQTFDKAHPGYQVITGDVRNSDVFSEASDFLRQFDLPVDVVNIGLTDYFDFAGFDTYTSSVIDVLKEFGGRYITADTHTTKQAEWLAQEFPDISAACDDIIHRANIHSLNVCNFTSADSMVDYYQSRGLNVKRHMYSDSVSELHCLEKLHISSAVAKRLILHYEVLEITLAQKED